MEYVRLLENRDNRARGEQVLASLEAMGLKPTIQECRWPKIRNIIADFANEKEPRQLVFSAHYDAVRGSPGANDNASGVAGMLEIASSVSRRAEQPSVTFLKLELLCDEHFPCICPGEGMGSVPVVSFDIEHDLINQFLF